ncbi:MAG TPA: ribbon-helix-helix protein, CopG family [Gaiellales bacterium]|jgi:hypothetical protein|nr:ribbon-helix-helix protein, CopG family [Gaiellales bacterium]
MSRRNSQVVLRVSGEELEQIDRLAADLHVGTRSEVLRCALARLSHEARERAIGEAYRRGYSAHPFPADDAERAWASAADELAAEGARDLAGGGE